MGDDIITYLPSNGRGCNQFAATVKSKETKHENESTKSSEWHAVTLKFERYKNATENKLTFKS